MQIIYKEKLLAQLEKTMPIPEGVREFFDLFFGGNLKEDCERLGVDYDSLEYENEKRRDRALWDSCPEQYRKAFLDYFNTPLVKREVLEIVLKRGVTALEGSDFMVWCDSSAAGKGNTQNLVAFRIDELIANVCKNYEWEPSYHCGRCSAIYIGPVALQMKGSGQGKKLSQPTVQNVFKCCY